MAIPKKNPASWWIPAGIVLVLAVGAISIFHSKPEWVPPRIMAAVQQWSPLKRLGFNRSEHPAEPQFTQPGRLEMPDDSDLDLGEQFEPSTQAADQAENDPAETAPAMASVRGERITRQIPSQPLSEDDSESPAFRRRNHDSRVVAAGFEDVARGEKGTSSGTLPKEKPAPVPEDESTKKKDADGSDPQKKQPSPLLELAEIQSLVDAGDYVAAQRELSKWYWRTPEKRTQFRRQLDDMAKSLYFSPQPLFHDPYVVQPGDQLRVIAQRYRLSWQYLSRLNNVDPKKIRMGQKLKVVEGPFSALISLSSYELIIHVNGSFVKSYRVGIGKEGTTPIGVFTVKTKLEDPTYYGPDGVVLAHDDPQNPLGERWIDIGDSYGIHGTIDPNSIGRNESRGCIRMLNSDVEEVYDLLVIGSQVRIQK